MPRAVNPGPPVIHTRPCIHTVAHHSHCCHRRRLQRSHPPIPAAPIPRPAHLPKRGLHILQPQPAPILDTLAALVAPAPQDRRCVCGEGREVSCARTGGEGRWALASPTKACYGSAPAEHRGTTACAAGVQPPQHDGVHASARPGAHLYTGAPRAEVPTEASLKASSCSRTSQRMASRNVSAALCSVANLRPG